MAVVAEASSVGLLGLSGWFIASCYLSGLNPLSRFSYLAPSGGVRSFALARIGGRYAERLVTHAATLRWLTRLRVQMFLDAATAGPDRRRLRSGEALDRAMSDADTLDRALIRTVVPVCVAVVAVLAGTGVISAVSITAGATFLAASVVTTVVALIADGRRDRHATVADSRGAARSEVIASVDAWAEMVSLGAVQQLRASSSAALDVMQQTESDAARARSHARLLVDCCVGVTVAAVLAVLAPPAPVSAAGDVSVASASGGLSIQVSRLPLAPAPGPGIGRLDLEIEVGELLVVSGRSGSGKTTLLRALAGELTPTTGAVLIGGHSPHAYEPRSDRVRGPRRLPVHRLGR